MQTGISSQKEISIKIGGKFRMAVMLKHAFDLGSCGPGCGKLENVILGEVCGIRGFERVGMGLPGPPSHKMKSLYA